MTEGLLCEHWILEEHHHRKDWRKVVVGWGALAWKKGVKRQVEETGRLGIQYSKARAFSPAVCSHHPRMLVKVFLCIPILRVQPLS